MKKLLRGLFVLLLVIFPVGQIGRIALGNGVNLLLNDVVVFFIFATWIITKVSRKEQFLKTQLTIPILLFVAVALLSLFVNAPRLSLPHVFISGLYLVRWICYGSLFFVVVDFDKVFKRKFLIGLMVSATVTAVIGLLQYFLYPNLRNLFYLGWDEHLFRLFSTILDPNFAGGIFVLGFLVAFFLLLKNDVNRIAYGISAFILAIATLLTYSRSGLVSFVIGLVVLLLLSGKKKMVGVFFLLFILAILLLPKNLGGEGVNLLRTASIEARFESSKEAIAIFQQYPVLGVGFNAYRYAREDMGFATANEYGDIHSAAGTDNSFLFVLATTGAVGLVMYMYLWFAIIKLFWKNPLVLATIIAIFVHTLFVNSLFYPWIMEWLWILFGVTYASKARKSL